MVAYSFQCQFVPLIEAGTKLQTMRPQRKRHARVGEPIQLFTGMRTRACRKIIEPDPICTAVMPVTVWLDVDSAERGPYAIEEGSLLIDTPELIEAHAAMDGFMAIGDRTARAAMGAFWLERYAKGIEGPIGFTGVLIRWSLASFAEERSPIAAELDELGLR